MRIDPGGSAKPTYPFEPQWSRARISVPFEADGFIGWYADRRIAGRRRRGDGYEAVVIDFQGQVRRVLTVIADAKKQEVGQAPRVLHEGVLR
ncbi:hypothetical protein ACQPYK_43690 [Streptosporangium sp. CA-135522]|uniref:hypothetical protein n=1 Tax=Streptosporangium sp. CA-135522 TaxID=3240072 RepID=UPI003D93A59A